MSDIAAGQVLARLSTVCRGHALEDLGDRLVGLARLVERDMAAVERELLASVAPAAHGERAVARGGAHLVAAGGKRLRPTCVVLAARLGGPVGEAALQLAVSVELVHSATLLHDDVVDLGDTRRGLATARSLYGNSVSIFAGDWLLVEALRRVRRHASPEVLAKLLDAIEEMIFAESLQLENRGKLVLDEAVWRRVAEGKTASLFAWAMLAGARVAGLGEAETDALARFGLHLGTAFQAVDDVLDFEGDPSATGKTLFADLREGKTTYPLILAARRDPDLAARLERGAADGDAAFAREILEGLRRTGALAEARAFAADQAERAADALSEVRAGPARDALYTVLDTTLARCA
ncbi:MAG: polyprenyl synthetase family protein [Sandaracinaceae bacterium]